ncbi:MULTISPECIES: hypothetical protein [unclassified Clostridium]|nr:MULTISPECIES: hypothetical protein [unclassified Clostridium]
MTKSERIKLLGNMIFALEEEKQEIESRIEALQTELDELEG